MKEQKVLSKKEKLIYIAIALVIVIAVAILTTSLVLRDSIFGKYEGFLCTVEFSGIDTVTVYRNGEKVQGKYHISNYKETENKIISFKFDNVDECSDLMKEAIASLGEKQTFEIKDGGNTILIAQVNKFVKTK